jgi:flagellar basal body P-ring formation protein FlgA
MDRTTTICRLLAGVALLAVLLGSGSTGTASAWQSLESIRAAAEAAALKAAPSGAEAVADSLDPRLRLVACSEPLTATVAANGVPSARLTAEVRCSGAQPWLLYLPVRMTSTRPLVVATRALARDTVLAPGDVRLAKAPLGSVPAGALHDAGLAVGRLLRRPVDEGQAIVVPLLAAPAVVRRGQQVSVEARTGGLTVTVAGVARRDGALGDTIPVESGTSGRIVEAVVRSAKSVEVLLR